MTAFRLMVLMAAGLALTACDAPKPMYVLQQTPPPYRKAPDGAIIDNAGVTLDAQGYRLDKNGQRIQEVDIPAKTAAYQSSSPVAGYYISSLGKDASGNVMSPSEGASQGYGSGPGAATMAPGGGAPPLPAPLVPTPGEAAPTPLQR